MPRKVVTQAVRQELERARANLGQDSSTPPSLDEIATRTATRVQRMTAPSLRPLINATGVILHTNLGRAPLSRSAVEAVAQVAGYSNLEYNLEEGERGSRYTHAAGILQQVTGCEDAIVVNNNAAGLVLALSALSAGLEAVVSRGQLVEIGGGFRIPDIMRAGGVRLVEVGTTNRTYLADYEAAITGDTALLMRVHTSNFRVLGFTTSPAIEELAELAHKHNLIALDDVGSGALLDTARYGLSPEPLVQNSIDAGCDLVLFSGDKLLGGPQCGIIVGKAATIARLRKHPLARALRVDKLTLAALEATLLHYLRGDAEREVPVWRMISMSREQIKGRAERWSAQLASAGIPARIEEGQSAIGGGSLPGDTLPTWLLVFSKEGVEAGQLAARLRNGSPPVIARVEHGAVLLDPRTVEAESEADLLRVTAEALA